MVRLRPIMKVTALGQVFTANKQMVLMPHTMDDCSIWDDGGRVVDKTFLFVGWRLKFEIFAG